MEGHFPGAPPPTGHKNLLRQRDADGFAGRGTLARWRTPTLDASDGAGLVRRREDEFVAYFDRAGFEAAGQNAPLVEAVEVLDGQAQRLVFWQPGNLKLIQGFKDRRALPPGH